jgi:dipeptidase
METMRDFYKGTEFDLTAHPAFNPGGKRSPLSRPWGSPELFNLLGIKPERCVGTEWSNYVFVNQIRDRLPDPVAGCMWFTYGPSYSGCFTPVYSGVTSLPDCWDRPPDFARINTAQTQWKHRLVHNLLNIKYRDAIKDVEAVSRPAEARFRAMQPQLEKAALEVFARDGAAGAQRFLTEYADQCLRQVDYAYGELVHHLMLKYLCMYPEVAPLKLPQVAAPVIPQPGSPRS